MNNFPNITAIFEDVVNNQGDDIAIIDGSTRVTYKELNKISNKLANYFDKYLENNFKHEIIIAITMEKSYLYIAAVLGILKCGCAFLPIDCEVPNNRKQYILKDSKADLLLTDNEKKIIEDEELVILNIRDTIDIWENEDDTYPSSKNQPDDLAYVIYTSGTTGNPKGTLLEHKGILNLKKFWENKFGISKKDKIVSFANISFDASIWEIFMAILTGAQLHIVSKETINNFRLFENYIEDKKITIITLPPTYSAYLNIKKLLSLRILFSAGSSASVEFYKKIHTETNILFVNAYGPTEATICTTIWEGKEECNKIIPIGFPIDNVEVHILNNKLQEVKNDEIGELVISGINVARGYLNNDELNKEKFIVLPSSGNRGYRTGDLASKDSNGIIYFHGRNDNQVKIGGHRIELDEIKSSLENDESIYEAAVINKKNMILAFYTQKKEKEEQEVLQRLRELLPNYMVPNYIKRVSLIPLTINGKPDTKKLIELYEESITVKHEEDNLDNDNSIIIGKCREVLENKNITENDNFFTLGGDSIKAIDLCGKLFDAGYELKLSDILLNPIIKEFSKMAKRVITTEFIDAPEGETDTVPIQRWFFHRKLNSPYQFNQSVILKGKGKIEIKKVEKSLQRIICHHEILRAKFDFNKTTKFMIQRQGNIKVREFYVNCKNGFYAIIKKIQQSLDPEKGVLMRAAVLNTATDSFLFVCIHHLVCDGISLRVILEDLIKLYSCRTDIRDIKLPVKTLSFRQWSIELKKNYFRLDLEDDIKYWLQIEKKLPHDRKIESGLNPMKIKTTIFDEEITKLIKNVIPQSYKLNINEILVAVFVVSYLQTFNSKKVFFNLELHGRDIVKMDLNISRTVGWFTSEYPQLITCNCNNKGIVELIDDIKSQLRSIPHKGQTYEMLKYYGKYNLGIPEPDINFNYMGEVSIEKNDHFELYFDADRMTMGSLGFANISDQDANYFKLNITPYIYENKLYFSCGYDPSYISDTLMEKLHHNFSNVFNSIARLPVQNNEGSEIDINVDLNDAELRDIFEMIEKL